MNLPLLIFNELLLAWRLGSARVQAALTLHLVKVVVELVNGGVDVLVLLEQEYEQLARLVKSVALGGQVEQLLVGSLCFVAPWRYFFYFRQ